MRAEGLGFGCPPPAQDSPQLRCAARFLDSCPQATVVSAVLARVPGSPWAWIMHNSISNDSIHSTVFP